MLTGKFIIVNPYIKKEERSQINNLIFHLKGLKKREQTKPKQTWKKKYCNRMDINEVGNRKNIGKINNIKRWFFVKINNTDKP